MLLDRERMNTDLLVVSCIEALNKADYLLTLRGWKVYERGIVRKG